MSIPRFVPAACAAVVLVCLASSAGCHRDSGKCPVSGTVTWNGQPLPEGYIIFEPLDRQTAPDAAPVRGGEFSLEAHPGQKRVEIHADRAAGAVDPAMGVAPREAYLPERYSGSTSVLRAEVRADGENRFTFPLTEEKPAG